MRIPRKRKAPSGRRLVVEELEDRHLLAGIPLANDANTLFLLHFEQPSFLQGTGGETPLQTPEGVSAVAGIINGGMRANNPGALRYIASSDLLAAQGTVELWVRPTWNGNDNATHSLFEVGGRFNNGMLLSKDGANNLWFIQWGDDPATGPSEANVERGIGFPVANWLAGDWHHVAATWNGTAQQMALYVDGQPVGQINNPVFIPAFSIDPVLGDNFTLGWDMSGTNSALANFDEFRISDQPRTAGEILADYQAGLGIRSLLGPRGVVADSQNRTIVAESDADRVAVFDVTGAQLFTIGATGTGNGLFRTPTQVAVDASDNIYVVDQGNHRVQRFGNGGNFLSQFGAFGTAPGQLNQPDGIAVDPASGKIYVADRGNHRVQRFLSTGAIDPTFSGDGVLGTTGTVKRDHTGFDGPTDVAIHPVTGEIYVADFGNQRLEVFSANGTYVRTYLAVYHPRSLAFDSAGNLYIAGEDPNDNYIAFDGRLRLLRAGDELIGEHYTGGLDDLSRIQAGVAVRPDGKIVVSDTGNGRLVQTDSALTVPVSQLDVDARGTSVTFRWRTAQPSPSKVIYGTTSQRDNTATDPTLTRDHQVTINGLTPNTRLFYGVSYSDSFSGAERLTAVDVINAGAPAGSTQFLRLKAAGVIYTDTQAGPGITPMSAAALAAARTRFQRIAEFYWRNSGFKVWPDIQIVEVSRDVTENPFSVLDKMESDLQSLGFSAVSNFDAAWGTSTLTTGNFGGAGMLFGRQAGMSQWVTQDDFVAIHEVNHSLDSIYFQNDLNKYEQNHGIWAVPNGVGRDISINGQILRNMLPANLTATRAPFNKILNAPDADNDGLPDSSPAGLLNSLSVTETTLGSSTALADTDSDGLTDRMEAMALPFHRTSLISVDSDGDRISDALDLNPAYRMNDRVRPGAPVIDGTIAPSEGWTILTDRTGFSNTTLVSDNNQVQNLVTTYAAWDANALYLALKGPPGSTIVHLDGSADGWFFNPDNYELTLSNSTSSIAVRVNVGVPDLFRQVDDDGQFSELFDTDPLFTNPYNGRPFVNQPGEGAGFPGRLVSEGDLQYQRGGSGSSSVWEVRIPWSTKTQFNGFAGKEMAISFDVAGDRLFSVDHAAKIRLIAAPDDSSILVAAPDTGMSPQVKVFDGQTLAEKLSFLAYSAAYQGGVHVATGDLTGDGIPDIITAPGRGGGPQVKVFDGVTGGRLPGKFGNFLAYASNFTGGVFVASGDVNGDGRDDIITVPGPGGGPQVRAFSGVDGTRILNFFAYPNSFTQGVFVSAGDINGDGRAEIITGPNTGAQQVKVFSGQDGSLMTSFFPYGPAFGGGVHVASGDVNADGRDDIITGPARGGGPQIRAFSGVDNARLVSFFAFDNRFTGGVRVASADVNADGHDDLVVGAGPGGGPQIKVFSGDGFARLKSFLPFANNFVGGIFVAGAPHGDQLGALRLADGLSLPFGATEPLTPQDLEWIRTAALALWEQTGLAHGSLDRIQFEIAELPGNLLGCSRENSIQIDRDAAGRGWFIDPTPDTNEEEFQQVDLLTVVLHELGHSLGLDHDADASLMDDTIHAGERRLPTARLLDALF